MKTLYISDLDGTLLGANARLSTDTIQGLCDLHNKGISFTCATARTLATVRSILEDVPIDLPIILMNGVAIYDLNISHYVKVEYIPIPFSTIMIEQLHKLQLTAFIYSISEDTLFTYYEQLYNEAMLKFYTERVTQYKKPYTQIDTFQSMSKDNIVYFLLLDYKERLATLYEWLIMIKDHYNIEACFYPDVYLKDTWILEVFSKDATKYNAVMYLKKHYQFETLVGFGDNLNDLPLFSACDESYAVENAREALKKVATNVIGKNTENAVVEFIKNREFY